MQIQGIMADPVMQSILQQAQGDPAALQEHMKNPGIRSKMYDSSPCLFLSLIEVLIHNAVRSSSPLASSALVADFVSNMCAHVGCLAKSRFERSEERFPEGVERV